MPELVVVAGLSGAGRSTAANTLEDLGWFVIDNLPPALIPKVVELAEASPGSEYGRLALVVGTGPEQDEVLPVIEHLATRGLRVRTLFLEASDEVLVRRYKDTRRRHPLSTGSLTEAVARERQLQDAVKGVADLVIDTTSLNVHQLRDRVTEAFSVGDANEAMQTRVTSFGYKHGVPTDVDVVLDCRFLPNPHWVEQLRPLTGLDPDVRDYVFRHELAQRFLSQVSDLLELLLPAFVAEGKSYLTIAFGCTGGRHRSVALAEEVARKLEALGFHPQVAHRDIEK
ncbi:MAG: RNase adapter RapZ [Acidimicrobiia bacterium]|nr:RNase adapter RapZ [Acidimicrobiia bacterium]